jgi:hypothetical protein
MIRIIGDGLIPEAKAFYDVRDALEFDEDVYLAAMLAPLFGVILKDVVIYNLEPLYDGCRSFSLGYLDVLKQNIVLDYSLKNVEYLKKYGIDAFYMPYGYHKSLERIKPAKKDIDVLLIGSVNPRRKHLLRSMNAKFNFVWAQNVYEANRDNLVARAKVHLNVHFCDDHPLEVVRLNYLMANHCNIVSERGNDEFINCNYSGGLRYSDPWELMHVCKDALEHPIDGYNCLKAMPHDCTKAQEWLRNNR